MRSFEWLWDARGEMPALDAFEALDEDGKAAVIAVFEHWGELEIGKHASTTRINEEHADPKILALKAGKHRFAMFHAGENIWIVCHYYKKQKSKLDKLGKMAISRTIAAKRDYEERVGLGGYYERH
ncbi:MAG: hypothetical protein ACYDFS_05170 [Vulcanimicrobiaceae bacterium]